MEKKKTKSKEVQSRKYVIGIYVRISKEDEDMGAKKLESNSITNQRNLIMDFISRQQDFIGCEIIEKCDDGYSGKRFDRPGFAELIELAKAGRIQCIIVKDFSRFGRDYLEVGMYLEEIFPDLGIRFIAVNDHFDSNYAKASAGLDVVFKNFINDYYSRDTSVKIRAIRKKMAQEGQFASSAAPYGYKKSKEDKHRLTVNPDTAPVVKEIFDLKLTGLSAAQIAATLNGRRIPSPAQYALDTEAGRDWRKINEKTAWTGSTVLDILRDERYAGHMVSLKRTLHGIYGREMRMKKEEWVKVENTHEAIISDTIFQKVQELITDFEKPYTGRKFNPYECGHCGRKLSLSKTKKKYWCRYGEVNPLAVCYKSEYEAEELRKSVFEELQWHLKTFLEIEKVYEKSKLAKVPVEHNKELYERNIELLYTTKTGLYEKYKDGVLGKEEYLSQRKEVDKKIEEYESMIRQCEIEKENGQMQEFSRVSELVHQYMESSELTQELQDAFIEKVIVYSKDRIKIVWKFEDVFQMVDLHVRNY